MRPIDRLVLVLRNCIHLKERDEGRMIRGTSDRYPVFMRHHRFARIVDQGTLISGNRGRSRVTPARDLRLDAGRRGRVKIKSKRPLASCTESCLEFRGKAERKCRRFSVNIPHVPTYLSSWPKIVREYKERVAINICCEYQFAGPRAPRARGDIDQISISIIPHHPTPPLPPLSCDHG
jgi:hypothetical protein